MKKENLPSTNEDQQEFFREFLQIQQQEILVKREELALRKNESEQNKDVALASIATQEKVELKRGDVYLKSQLSKFKLWGVIASLFTVIIISAMYWNKSDIAIRIIEVGGAAILSYFAGINKGKAQALEQQNRQKDE